MTRKRFITATSELPYRRAVLKNNFRRVIAALIPQGEFCNHKINYVPGHKSALPLKFIAALLNSDLIDWYFRLGSTNAAVSHYQLYNLPCPSFRWDGRNTNRTLTEARALVEGHDTSGTERYIARLIDQPPFDPAIASIIVLIVDRIIEAEHQRGAITRSARSQLALQAQDWQDVIDRSFALMAGISREEHQALKSRLSAML